MVNQKTWIRPNRSGAYIPSVKPYASKAPPHVIASIKAALRKAGMAYDLASELRYR